MLKKLLSKIRGNRYCAAEEPQHVQHIDAAVLLPDQVQDHARLLGIIIDEVKSLRTDISRVEKRQQRDRAAAEAAAEAAPVPPATIPGLQPHYYPGQPIISNGS